jgi:hypothetical protein
MARLRIPDVLADRVIEEYILGGSIRDVECILKISKSSVNKMITCDPNYFDIRAKHVLAVNLGRNGLDVKQYSALIRASNLLKKHGVEQINAEEYIIRLVSACFDLNLSPVDLVNFLFDFRSVCTVIHWTPRRLQEFVAYKLRILYHTNRQILEESKTLNAIRSEVAQQMLKLQENYPHYAASLDAKDQLNEKLTNQIKQMEAERAPLACPFA